MKKCLYNVGLAFRQNNYSFDEHSRFECFRRKKKCIRFISENEVDDYMPHHHHAHTHSYHAAAAAAAAAAFNHHQQQQQPTGSPQTAPHHPYSGFTAARRQANSSIGAYPVLGDNRSSPHLRKQPFLQSSTTPFGNGIEVGQQQRLYARQSIPSQFGAYGHPTLGGR